MTKKITIRYFAKIRETLGKTEEIKETTATTVGELRMELVGQGGLYAEALNSNCVLRAAVNQYMVADGEQIVDGDEVAFFPPVTGG